MSTSPAARRAHAMPFGATVREDGSTRFRLWAPEVESLSLRMDGEDQEMSPAGDGWFELLATGIAPETRYQFVLPDGRAVPDPAARAQDGGVGEVRHLEQPRLKG